MLNKATLIGRVGKDPEIRATSGGGKIAKFGLATTNKYKNKEGEKIEDTTWHNIVMFGKLADLAESYIEKGSLLYVEGRIENRKVESDDGPAKFFSSIIVEQMKFLSFKPKDGEERPAKSSKDKKQNVDDMMGDDEIPY